MFRKRVYSGANAIVLVFDLTRPETFEQLEGWVNEVIEQVGLIPVILIGNKTDLEMVEVSESQVKEKEELIRRKFGELYIGYCLTSAKTGEEVESAFTKLLRYTSDRICCKAPFQPLDEDVNDFSTMMSAL